MRNLDAIASLKYLITAYELEYRETAMMIKPEDYEAFKLAIKALEAQEQAIKEAYEKGYEYGVKEWFEKRTKEQTCIEDYPTCTECEHYDKDKHYCPRFCQVIKDALAETQPCEDCISRQAVIDKATSWDTHFADSERYVSLSNIMALPSVTPQASEEDIHREREQAYMLGYEDASKKFRTEPCEDCISRKAVEEIVTKEFVNPQDGTEEWRSAVNDVVEEILHKVEDLPSVTPQRPNCGAEMSGGEEDEG